MKTLVAIGSVINQNINLKVEMLLKMWDVTSIEPAVWGWRMGMHGVETSWWDSGEIYSKFEILLEGGLTG